MHHVFYTENGISLAIVLQYIEDKDIDVDKVLLLFGRNMTNPTVFKSIDVSSFEFKTGLNFISGWKKTFEIKVKVDKLVFEYDLKKFFFYTSSISKLSTYFIRTHPNVARTIMIEEGRASYYNENEFRRYIRDFHYSTPKYFIFQLKSFINYFFLHYPNPNKTISFLKKNNYVLVYGEESYNYVKNRILVSNPFKKNDNTYIDVTCVMCLSYPVEDGLIHIDDYVSVLKDSFNYLVNIGVKKIHYKFHPHQFKYLDNIKRYKEVFSSFNDVIEFVMFDNSVIIEVVLANSNAMLLSDYSSVMIYSRNFGTQIVSNYNLIEKYRKTNNDMPLLPNVMKRIIEKSQI